MVKYPPINQFIKGFSPSMAVNSYLNGNVEGKQFYFSFGSFSTERSLNLGLLSRDLIFRYVLHIGYNLVKHCAKTYVKTGLGNLICAPDEPSELEQILREI